MDDVEEIETEVDRLERRLAQQKEHQQNMFRCRKIQKKIAYF